MKRIATILCMLVLLIFPSIVYASTNEPIKTKKLSETDADYSEIIGLDEKIKQMINSIREDTNTENLPNDYKIDYTKANKIYVDTDIFSLETSKKQEVKEALDEGMYMWLLTLNIDNTAYQINISKGLPLNESLKEVLTEEEIETIKEEEGRWIVVAIEIFEGKSINYEATIAKILKDINYESDVEILLCGGLKHIYQPVALVMNNEEVELLIPLYDLEIRGTEKQINCIKPIAAHDLDGIYMYSGIKDAVNEMKDPNKDSVGSGAYIELSSEEHLVERRHPIVITIALFGVAMAIIYSIRKRNKMDRF